MQKTVPKFGVSRSDVWSALVLSVCVGVVLTLAVRAPATAHQGSSTILSSSATADQAAGSL